MKARLVAFLVLTLVTVAAPAWAAWNPDDALPVDPDVRIGHLDNGLTYYVRVNHKPEDRAELRLVVNAGSVLEQDDQQGLAHLVEHMCFNGTEHFQHNELVSFLESIGSRFGADLNAYTSFDETVYMLEIPTDKPGLLDKGMLVLGDWAHAVTFDTTEVRKERGVVMEEWRLGRGAQERVRKIQWPVLFKGSRYADRLPIGKADIIEHAPASRITDFYHHWYQPKLMAVVAVGAFDPDSVVALIHLNFGHIPAAPADLTRPAYPVPSTPGMLAAAATDSELTYSQVGIMFKHPSEEQGKVRDYRRSLVTGLFSSMLNARLQEIAQKPGAPFLFAGSGGGSLVRTEDVYQAFAVTPEGGISGGLDALMTEIARVRAHGFEKAELDRAKSRFLAGLEKAYNERDKTESKSYVGEYVNNYLEREPIPSISDEYDLARDLMSQVTLNEVNGAISRLVHDDNTVILASGPRKAGAAMPPADTLLAVARRAAASAPAAYVDSLAGAALMAKLPEPGKLTGRKERKDLGVTILDYENGLQIWLKPTDFKNDEVLFGAQAPGGTSLADSADFPSADIAENYAGEAGEGGFTPSDVDKILSGKIVSVSPSVDVFTEGIQGRTTPADLESALQLAHLQITAPDDRADAFQVVLTRFKEFVQNRASSPEGLYGDTVTVVTHGGNFMFQPTTVAYLNHADREKAYAFYRARMAEAPAWRWFMVGSFKVDEAQPLIARYLGSLPPAPAVPEFRANGLAFPSGRIEKTVVAGNEPKSRTLITWPAHTGLDEMKMYYLRTANEVLEIRLRDILREELGGTYSVNVGSGSMLPYPGYETTYVTYGSSPENARKLRDRVFTEVSRFKKEGPTPEEIGKVKEMELREVQTREEQNGYWLASFTTVSLLGWDPATILQRKERVDKITAPALQKAVADNYPEDNYAVITLMPKGAAAGGEGSRK